MNFNLCLGICALLPVALLSGSGHADELNSCARDGVRLMTVSAGCLDRQRGVAWGFRAPEALTRQQAEQFCASMGTTVNAAGKSVSWRLPSINDFAALGTVSHGEGAVTFPVHHMYWAFSSHPQYGVAVIPSTSERFMMRPDETAAAVCVATIFGCPSENERFQTGQGGCVDKLTGFVWDSIHSALPEAAAKQSCLDQIRHGFSDWEFAPADHVWWLAATGELAFLYPSADFIYPTINGQCWSLKTRRLAYCLTVDRHEFACVRRPKR